MIGVGQFCINVSDLEQSIAFYTQVLGLKLEHRIELPGLTEAVLVGDDGAARIQLAQQLEQDAPIKHSNGFWKLYINTDDCIGLYKKAIDNGIESVSEPRILDQWNVTIAFIKDPDGYVIELMEQHTVAA